MFGSLLSLGSFLFTAATRSRIWFSANFTSVSRVNSATTVDLPSALVELKRLIPEMVLISSSIGLEIKVSTSEGPAPG